RNRLIYFSQTTRRPLQQEQKDKVLGRTSTRDSRGEGHRQKYRRSFAGRAGYRAVVTGRTGTGPADGTSRYNVARFSGQASVGTKVVEQTEYREHDQPVARTIRQAAAAVELIFVLRTLYLVLCYLQRSNKVLSAKYKEQSSTRLCAFAGNSIQFLDSSAFDMIGA